MASIDTLSSSNNGPVGSDGSDFVDPLIGKKYDVAIAMVELEVLAVLNGARRGGVRHTSPRSILSPLYPCYSPANSTTLFTNFITSFKRIFSLFSRFVFVVAGSHHELTFRAAGLKRQRDQMLADAQRNLDARMATLASLHAHEEALVEAGLKAAVELVRASVGAELAERVAALETRRDYASGAAKPAAVSTRSLRHKRLKSEGAAEDDEDDSGATDAGGGLLGGALAALAFAGAAASKNNDGLGGRRRRALSPASLLLDKQLDEEEVRSDLYDIARDMQLLEHSQASSSSSSSSSNNPSLPHKRPAARPQAVAPAAPQFRGSRVVSGAFGHASGSHGSYGTGSSLLGADAPRHHGAAHSATSNGYGTAHSSSGPAPAKLLPLSKVHRAAAVVPSAAAPLPGEVAVVPNTKLGQVRCGAEVFEKGDPVLVLRASPPETKFAAKLTDPGGLSDGSAPKDAPHVSSVSGTVSSVNNSEVHLRLEDGSKHRVYLSHLRNGRTVLKHA
jgi:hypothetical protein